MSEQKPPTQQVSTPEEQYQQMFSQLSEQYKKPLRNIMGETQEAIQNTISNIIQQLININLSLKSSNQEIIRLQKLCADNKISSSLPPPNRAERRKMERKQAKTS